MDKEEIIVNLEAIIIYCNSSRKATKLSLCKLQIRDEIQPRAEKLLKELSKRFFGD